MIQRHRHLVATLCFLALLPRGATAQPAAAAEERRVPVETIRLATRVFEDRLAAQGNLEARSVALVPARVPGTLMKLYVDEGDRVEAGKTPLLLTDDLKLRKAVELRRLDLAVSHCGVLEKAAKLEKEKAAFDRAEQDYKRQSRLYAEDRIGTLDAVEQAEAAFKMAAAEVKHAESLLGLAKEQERQAAANLEMAQKDLSDATVLAPIGGVVSRRFQDVGEMGGPAQPVFRIEDLDQLEVSVFLPARHYAAIEPERTKMHIVLEQGEIGVFPVSYRSPTINPTTRLFEVKCRLARGAPGAVPGAMCTATAVLRSEEGLGLPRQALVSRNGVETAFVVQDGRARAVAVETGLETDGWVLVKAPELAAGAEVVVRGQFLLNDGSAIAVRGGDGAAPGGKDH